MSIIMEEMPLRTPSLLHVYVSVVKSVQNPILCNTQAWQK